MSTEGIILLSLGLVLAGCQRDNSFPEPPAKEPSVPNNPNPPPKAEGKLDGTDQRTRNGIEQAKRTSREHPGALYEYEFGCERPRGRCGRVKKADRVFAAWVFEPERVVDAGAGSKCDSDGSAFPVEVPPASAPWRLPSES